MTISLQFYLDQNLTMPLSGPLTFEQATDLSTGPQTKVIYLGSTLPSRQFEAASNPGVDPILVTVTDSEPGTGQETTNVRLALDPNNLASITPGDNLSLPVTILSGSINAVPVYVQVEDTNGMVATDTSLSLTTNSLIETEVTP